MSEYWKTRPTAPVLVADTADPSAKKSHLSDFSMYRRKLALDADSGWESELRRYLGIVPPDVTPETDIVEWWSVSNSPFVLDLCDLIIVYRFIKRSIQLLHASHLTCSQAKHRPSPVNGYSLPANKLQLIDVLDSVPRDLKNCKCSSSHGVTRSQTKPFGIRNR